MADRLALGIFAVRAVHAGDRPLFIVGGEHLDREFLSSIVLPAGVRALLYRNLETEFSPADLIDASGPITQAPLLSRRAATRLGFLKDGRTRVRTEVLAWGDNR